MHETRLDAVLTNPEQQKCPGYKPNLLHAGLVDDGTHTALVMRYYKRGTVSAAMCKPEYRELDMAQRLKMALQVCA